MTPKQNFNAKNHPLKDVYKALGIDPPAPATPDEDKENAALMEKIRAAHAADPGWEKAIRKIAEAEAKYGMEDPAEGKIVNRKAAKGPK